MWLVRVDSITTSTRSDDDIGPTLKHFHHILGVPRLMVTAIRDALTRNVPGCWGSGSAMAWMYYCYVFLVAIHLLAWETVACIKTCYGVIPRCVQY
jgi:hypothetical protein